MELRHLRYFVAVADSLHFGRAAAKLHIAQPSLSHQVQQLESELRTRLLRRTKRHVELTEAGRLFLEEARDVLARADRAAVIARRAGRGDMHRLRVGIGYCMVQANIAKCLGEFNALHEDVLIEIKTMSVPSQLVAIRDGQLDVGFVRPPVVAPSVKSELILREPMIVALPRDHRLAHREHIALQALEKDNFILPPRDAVPVFHDAVLKACREVGFVPHAPHEADHLLLILGMVAARGGVALIPDSARKVRQSGLVFRELRPSATLETAVAWRSLGASDLILSFVDDVRRLGAFDSPKSLSVKRAPRSESGRP